MPDPHEDKHAIIIVRRKKPGDHGHHGGAWKIAYADFVTAMMAFFLVMWLINAANEKTRAQVASYFNPIKLTDTSTAKKGLNSHLDRNPIEGKEKSGQGDQSSNDKAKPATESVKTDTQNPPSEKRTQYTEDQIFRNPYGILGLLAGQAITEMPGHGKKGLAIVEVSTGDAKDGQSHRDPFDPYVWRTMHEKNLQSAGEAEQDSQQTALTSNLAPAPKATVSDVSNQTVTVEPLKSPIIEEKAPKKIENISPVVAAPQTPINPEVSVSDSATEKDAISIRDKIVGELKDFSADDIPNFEVKATGEGILISLTDNLNFDMFRVGSSQPQPKVVLVMEKITAVIKEYDGKIVVRGHTDSRPFKNGGNDNWRLSTSRAQMAFYMLVRAGLDEQKVERVEGYADHRLKYPGSPESAGNRRIEILLKVKRL